MSDNDLILRPKRPKGEDGYKVFSIRIKEDLAERLSGVAAQTGHSRNELIGTLLEYALKHCTIADK